LHQPLKQWAIVIARARHLIGQATYRLDAGLDEAPRVVNCLTLVALAYQPIGIELASTTLEGQLAAGGVVEFSQLTPGDLIFTGGYQAYFEHPDYGGIGHVGLFTERGTVIHATKRRGRCGVIEDDLAPYLAEGGFRVACRILRSQSWPASNDGKGGNRAWAVA
jgi:cell wall-associated NlpC family hydrolase